uniref:Uncharacterized protein n=1 Tax=Oryza barthii TaxID=65489 RepID=A0A0D3HD67_9ORYZ
MKIYKFSIAGLLCWFYIKKKKKRTMLKRDGGLQVLPPNSWNSALCLVRLISLTRGLRGIWRGFIPHYCSGVETFPLNPLHSASLGD